MLSKSRHMAASLHGSCAWFGMVVPVEIKATRDLKMLKCRPTLESS